MSKTKEFISILLQGAFAIFLAYIVINLTMGYFQRQCRERFGDDYSYGGGRNHLCVNSEGNLKLLNK